MPRDASTTEKIIRATEKRMRDSGYHGFSFRDIAADVGIKSSSVHHHFPTKDALGAAAARAYAERFLEALGDPSDRPMPDALAHMVSLFKQALETDAQMCLCGLLGAECASLPAAVKNEARYFFGEAQAWLMVVMGEHPGPREAEAQTFLAALEGAMLIAHATDESGYLENVGNALLSRFGAKPAA